MTEDVEDCSVRIDHKEATNAPRFVGQRVSDLKTTFDRTRVDLVDVRHLDTHIGSTP